MLSVVVSVAVICHWPFAVFSLHVCPLIGSISGPINECRVNVVNEVNGSPEWFTAPVQSMRGAVQARPRLEHVSHRLASVPSCLHSAALDRNCQLGVNVTSHGNDCARLGPREFD